MASKDRLFLKNAQIMWKNFTGSARKFNDEGDRNFAVVLQPGIVINGVEAKTMDDIAQAVQLMQGCGWNIKTYLPANAEEGVMPIIYLPVKVSYEHWEPKVYMVCGKNKTILNAETVSMLDDMSLTFCDIQINPYNWSTVNGSGVKAYLAVMYANLDPNDIAARYMNLEGD